MWTEYAHRKWWFHTLGILTLFYFIFILFSSLFNLLILYSLWQLCKTSLHLLTSASFSLWATGVQSLTGPVFLSNRTVKFKIACGPSPSFIYMSLLWLSCAAQRFCSLVRNWEVLSPQPFKKKDVSSRLLQGAVFYNTFSPLGDCRMDIFWKFDSCMKNGKMFFSLLRSACSWWLVHSENILERRVAVSCAQSGRTLRGTSVPPAARAPQCFWPHFVCL